MNSRLGLFRNIFKRAVGAEKLGAKRRLYTDSIYPYPNRYFNEKLYPSMPIYRETFVQPEWSHRQNRIVIHFMKFFWAYIWYNAFSNPEYIFGHYKYPDMTKFSDEELGIPPSREGPYDEWLAQKLEHQQ